MELKNKKIAFLGDSITQGCSASKPENFYWNLVATETGAIGYGYGIGGTRIAPQRIPSGDPVYDQYFISRVDEMIPDADIVVVFGGTNDFGHGDAPFGTWNDRGENTFCGAVHTLLQKLIARYPHAQLVMMTPLHREDEERLDYGDQGKPRQARLEAYVDAIIRISGYYGVPVLDLFRVSGMQPAIPLLKELFNPDGLHPNDAGHRKIADRLIGFLRTL